jgi:hypothetical protein
MDGKGQRRTVPEEAKCAVTPRASLAALLPIMAVVLIGFLKVQK